MPDPGAITWLRRLLTAGTVLALAVVVLGAYVRLRDAGLGCPDWPGCYGQLVGVPATDAGGAPIDRTKAWIEVAHRYLAASLGLLALGAVALAWLRPVPAGLRWLVAALLALIIGQGVLGALTVTELLKPAIVTAHLLGGMAILATLAACSARAGHVPGFRGPAARVPAALATLAVVGLAMQVALGGWVSTNYAGLACGLAPLSCQGTVAPPADMAAFALDRDLGRTAAGEPLTQRALATVNWVHRLGAVAVTLVLAALAAALWRRQGRRPQAVALGAVLAVQAGLGLHITMAALPLWPSLLHNAGAALLCVTLAAVVATPIRGPGRP